MAFKKGVSGNASGRPKLGISLAKLLADRLLEKRPGDKGKTHGRLIAERLVELCLSEDERTSLEAIKYAFDRVDGKPAETVDHTSGGEPVSLADVFLAARGKAAERPGPLGPPDP